MAAQTRECQYLLNHGYADATLADFKLRIHGTVEQALARQDDDGVCLLCMFTSQEHDTRCDKKCDLPIAIRLRENVDMEMTRCWVSYGKYLFENSMSNDELSKKCLPYIQTYIGFLESIEENNESARCWFNCAITSTVDDDIIADISGWYAEFLAKIERYTLAEMHFELAIKNQCNWNMVKYAIYLNKRDQFKKACDYFEKVLKTEADNVDYVWQYLCCLQPRPVVDVGERILELTGKAIPLMYSDDSKYDRFGRNQYKHHFKIMNLYGEMKMYNIKNNIPLNPEYTGHKVGDKNDNIPQRLCVLNYSQGANQDRGDRPDDEKSTQNNNYGDKTSISDEIDFDELDFSKYMKSEEEMAFDEYFELLGIPRRAKLVYYDAFVNEDMNSIGHLVGIQRSFLRAKIKMSVPHANYFMDRICQFEDEVKSFEKLLAKYGLFDEYDASFKKNGIYTLRILYTKCSKFKDLKRLMKQKWNSKYVGQDAKKLWNNLPRSRRLKYYNESDSD